MSELAYWDCVRLVISLGENRYVGIEDGTKGLGRPLLILAAEKNATNSVARQPRPNIGEAFKLNPVVGTRMAEERWRLSHLCVLRR